MKTRMCCFLYHYRLVSMLQAGLFCSTLMLRYIYVCCVIIIIIINFYVAFILRNLSSEAQQNRIIKHSHEQGRAKVIIRTRDNQRFMVEMQFGINMS